MRHKKKYLKTKSHIFLSESIINKYCVEKLKLCELENILQKHVNDYNKKFVFYEKFCKWELQFTDALVSVKSKGLCSDMTNWKLEKYLNTNIENLGKRRFETSHIQQMIITFIASQHLWSLKLNSMVRKKMKNARRNGFKFNQKTKLTINIYRYLSNISIHFYLKHRFPLCHRQFFRILSRNPEYVKPHCSNRSNPFDLACRKWFLQDSPQ